MRGLPRWCLKQPDSMASINLVFGARRDHDNKSGCQDEQNQKQSSKALLGVFAGRRAGGETGGTAGPAGMSGSGGHGGHRRRLSSRHPAREGRSAEEGAVEIAGGGSACAAPGPMTTRVNSLGPGGTGLRGCIGGPGSLRGDTSGSTANAGWAGGDTRAGLLVPNSCVYSPAPAEAPGEEGRSVPPPQKCE